MFELKDARGDPFSEPFGCLYVPHVRRLGRPECTHNQDLIPPGKSAAKLDMVRALYGDQRFDGMREYGSDHFRCQ